MLCGCQPVGSAISAIVAPLARASSFRTIADLVCGFGRVSTSAMTSGGIGAGQAASPASGVDAVVARSSAVLLRDGVAIRDLADELVLIGMVRAPVGRPRQRRFPRPETQLVEVAGRAMCATVGLRIAPTATLCVRAKSSLKDGFAIQPRRSARGCPILTAVAHSSDATGSEIRLW